MIGDTIRALWRGPVVVPPAPPARVGRYYLSAEAQEAVQAGVAAMREQVANRRAQRSGALPERRQAGSDRRVGDRRRPEGQR